MQRGPARTGARLGRALADIVLAGLLGREWLLDSHYATRSHVAALRRPLDPTAYREGLADRARSLELDPGTVWRRLQIVDAVGGGAADAEGVVEFRASYRDADGAGLLHERSRFIREDGRWVYLDGDVR